MRRTRGTGRRASRAAALSRAGAAALAAALVGGLLALGAAPVAAAALVPAAPPSDVSARALPTVQVDGVVWASVVVGDRVFAGGSFATARPAGAAPGTSTTPRGNLLAFDLRTGALDTGFAPSLDGQVLALEVSPDGRTLYVAGEFTRADGQPRYRLAAYDVATGALTGFAPVLDYRARALAVLGEAVYVGGAFSTADGNARQRLAAFRASDGALLDWAPSADGQVLSLAVAEGGAGARVVVGGQFTSVAGRPTHGLAALDPVSGAALPFPVAERVRDAGTTAGITSLTVAGDAVYGTGYSQQCCGNLEGAFAAGAADGELRWVQDCHGDTYDAHVVGSTVYTVGHAYDCARLGGHSATQPATYQRALAFTTRATGTLAASGPDFPDWGGTPAPSLLHWFPTVDAGSYTGQTQGAWTVTGDERYVVLGGEFPRVNRTAQQGLVRFAVRGSAPTDVPEQRGAGLVPEVVAVDGALRVSWPESTDRDDPRLRYELFRDGAATPVLSTTTDSAFWRRDRMAWFDRTVVPGTRHRYRLAVTDPSGNRVLGDSAYGTAPPAAATSPYADAVRADGPLHWWRSGDGSARALDSARADDLSLSASARGTAPGPLSDGASALRLPGDLQAVGTTQTAQSAPRQLGLEVWVRAAAGATGRVVGFGTAPVGSSFYRDRHLWVRDDGRISFGLDTVAAARVLTSTVPVADGTWHHVVAGVGPDGAELWVDGVRQASDTSTAEPRAYDGFWRVGADDLAGWAGRPASDALAGDVAEVAVYAAPLTPEQVQRHWAAARPPAPAATASATPTATATPTSTTAPGPAEVLLAADDFERAVPPGGLGAADTGGTWTTSGRASDASVTGGTARLALPSAGAQLSAALGDVSSSATDVEVVVGLDKTPTGGGTYVSVVGRRASASTDYRAKLRYLADGSLSLSLNRLGSGTDTTLTGGTVPGLRPVPGERVRVRLQVSGTGTTQVRAKAWQDGTPEPEAWLRTASDTTAALQVRGAVGVVAYRSGSATGEPQVVSFDALRVRPLS